jgi:predicted thioesterase
MTLKESEGMVDVLAMAFLVGLLIRTTIKLAALYFLADALWPGEITVVQVVVILLAAEVLDGILSLFKKK